MAINTDAVYAYYGFDEEGEPDYESDGWVQWNGSTISIPHGLWINPSDTMPLEAVLYNVYRITEYAFHDVVWLPDSGTWEANTYSSAGEPSERNQWIWDEENDIILSQYVLSADGNITSAQLFTPPKKYSELAEVGLEGVSRLDLLLDQEGVFNRLTNNGAAQGLFMEEGNLYINASYIHSGTLTLGGTNNQNGNLEIQDDSGNVIGQWDNNGIRGDWFEFNSDSSSATIGRNDDPESRNVYIDNDSVDIRKGQDVLASFGETTTVGKQDAAHVDITGDRVSFKVGINEVAYIDVDSETLQALFYMTKAVVVNDLHFGNWQWKGRDNGNLTLKWIGGDV